MTAGRKEEIEYWGAGFPVHLLEFPALEEEGARVPDVAYGRLHKLIAHRIVHKPFLLTGAEVAFLRSIARLSRSEAARRLGVTRRTLINWEECGQEPIRAPVVSHPGIRLLFAVWIFPADRLDVLKIAAFEPVLSPAPIALEYSDFRSFQNCPDVRGHACDRSTGDPRNESRFSAKK